MKTLKQFIEEANKRPLSRSQEILGYLGHKSPTGRHVMLRKAQRHINQEISDKYPTHPLGYENAVAKLSFYDPLVRKKKFKVKDLIPIQGAVDAVGVNDKMTGAKLGSKGPIRVATYKGKHYVVDGHHRWFGAKLNRDEEIEAYHHEVPEKKKKMGFFE